MWPGFPAHWIVILIRIGPYLFTKFRHYLCSTAGPDQVKPSFVLESKFHVPLMKNRFSQVSLSWAQSGSFPHLVEVLSCLPVFSLFVECLCEEKQDLRISVDGPIDPVISMERMRFKELFCVGIIPLFPGHVRHFDRSNGSVFAQITFLKSFDDIRSGDVTSFTIQWLGI